MQSVCSLELSGTVFEWSCCSLDCSAVRKRCCGIVFATSSLLWLKLKSVYSSNKLLLLPISSCSEENLNFTVCVLWRSLCCINTCTSTLVKYVESLPFFVSVFIISLLPLNSLLTLVIYSAGLFLSSYLNIWRIFYPNQGLKLFWLLLRCRRLIHVELIESTLVNWKGNLSHDLTQFFVPFNCTNSQLIIMFNIQIGFIS